ncbi:SRPBCC domain-containing protein [Anderseniella sp. Alg231-50]|uniref:SRPBCC domain-containing protein n=1 Tax=Anderseniella sp. Alg231-50 TaxID=1922226 RepID=UPI000D54B0D4
MKMTGEEVIAAPRQAVWDALNDPEILKQAITGCQEVKKKSDTEFEAKVTAKVGPVKASFIGDVKLSKLNPPRSYVISGEGKGGVAGFAKGGATVRLSDTGDSSTKLSYDVDAQVGGKLAQIGSRLIDSTAKKMAADFFKKFNKIVSQGSEDTDMTKKPTAKKAAAKKPAAKAAKPAVAKAAAKKAAAKPAAKASKAAAKPAAKAAAKAKPAAKTAAKSTVSAASKTASAARKSAASAAGAASAAASETASTVADAANKAASEATSAAKSAAANAGQMAETARDTASDNIPPQVKSMSGMWTWVMLAAAAGLVLLWATGK